VMRWLVRRHWPPLPPSFVYGHTSSHAKGFILYVVSLHNDALELPLRPADIYGPASLCSSVAWMDHSTIEDIPVPETPLSTGFLDVIQEKVEDTADPISPPPSSQKSDDSLPRRPLQLEVTETPFRPSRRLPPSPSTSPQDTNRSTSRPPETIREKSPISLSSLSDYNGSEDSHAQRRFLRHYEELESHCSGFRCLEFALT
jgi:hypothetical protein